MFTRRRFGLLAALLGLGIAGVAPAADDPPKPPLRAGIIGLDTSHVVAFTQVLNAPTPEGGKPRSIRVVAAYAGGSRDLPSSIDRVPEYTKTLKEKFGIEIVDSIDELLKRVDVVLLESVDGRPHLDQVRPVLEARKPVFIDKPVAGSLADAIRIYDLAREAGVPCFSSSALRFSPNIAGLAKDPAVGTLVGAITWGPSSLEEHHPDLFWYGIHGVEALYTVMGTGCETVARTSTPDTDVVTGVWSDGRVGTFRGIRSGKADFGAVAFGTKGIVPISGYGGYEPLLDQICSFFETGQPPVAAETTIEMFAFMEAADESKRRGGAPVSIKEVIERARASGSAAPAR